MTQPDVFAEDGMDIEQQPPPLSTSLPAHDSSPIQREAASESDNTLRPDLGENVSDLPQCILMLPASLGEKVIHAFSKHQNRCNLEAKFTRNLTA